MVRALALLDTAKRYDLLGGLTDGTKAAQLAFEIASETKEIAAMKAAELTALLPPPPMEAQLEEDLIRIASGDESALPVQALVTTYRSS